jgi:hypothetical protein
MSEQRKCPNCKNEVPDLVRLDESFRAKVSEQLGVPAPEALCANCFQLFEKKEMAQADKEARRATKEANRLSLWRRRVDIMRDARDRFATKDFVGAVVSYEKYLRVVEMIYDVKPNHLQVSFFSNPARAKELVLITTSYWDLIRIYDQSDRFKKRFNECAEKFVEFLPFTPMYSEMLQRIQDYKKVAKHKDVFQKIYKQVQKKKKRCFIATAAFQYEESPTVSILCAFRDKILINSFGGRALIRTYYLVSPPFARLLDRSPQLRVIARSALNDLAHHIESKYHLKS